MLRERQTRGKTRAGRLLALDRAWIRFMRATQACAETDLQVADIGFGDRPVTSWEWWQALSRGGGTVWLHGIENDADRVGRARRWFQELQHLSDHQDEGSQLRVDDAVAGAGLDCDLLGGGEVRPSFCVRVQGALENKGGLHFIQGSFDLPRRHFHLIRAMNVLRQYREAEVLQAHRQWGRALRDQGWLLEGTCDPKGRVLVCHWMQRRGDWLHRDSLLFATDGSQGSAPFLFGDRLPKDLRAFARQPVGIGLFLGLWQRAWLQARDQWGAPESRESTRDVWMQAQRILGGQRQLGDSRLFSFCDEAQLELRWRPPLGVPFALDPWIQPRNGPARALYLGKDSMDRAEAPIVSG